MPQPRTTAWRNRLLAGLAVVWLAGMVAIWLAPSLVAEAAGESLVDGFRWRAALASTLLLGVTVAIALSDKLNMRLWRFLLASAAPLNLAVLRVAVFAILQLRLRTEPVQPAAAALPLATSQSPPLLAPVLEVLPFDSQTVDVLLPVATVATLLALLGVLSRVAAGISALLSAYLLAIPVAAGAAMENWYPLLGVALLLACTRCGDALSIDALWHAVRRADRGQVIRVPSSVRYGLPLRLSLVLLVTAYFAPAFWTLAGDGISHSIFSRESIAGDPLLGILSAMVLVAGPLALWWPTTRYLWASIGITLHALSWLMTGVGHFSYAALYVAFVDWQRGLAKLGRWLFGPPMVVLYDGNCKMCRRIMSLLLALDWLKSLDGLSAFERSQIDNMGLGYLPDEDLMRDMHAGERTTQREWRVTKGYQAYQRIAWRVPLLWPTLPLIYLPPVVALGDRIYRHVADTRACAVPLPNSGRERARAHWSPVPLCIVASLLLAIQIALGLGRTHLGSPLGSLPTARPSGIPKATSGQDSPILRAPAGSHLLRNERKPIKHATRRAV